MESLITTRSTVYTLLSNQVCLVERLIIALKVICHLYVALLQQFKHFHQKCYCHIPHSVTLSP